MVKQQAALKASAISRQLDEAGVTESATSTGTDVLYEVAVLGSGR